MPTENPLQSDCRASVITKAGAAIIDTPRSAFEQIDTPKATNIFPSNQRSSDDFEIFFIMIPFNIFFKN
jgi:hypothetical protein